MFQKAANTPASSQMNQDPDRSTSSLKTQRKGCLLRMVHKSDKRSPGSETSHTCSRSCLGPLTFHPEAVGSEVHLTHGGRLAERSKGTFKNALIFSSRPVQIREKTRLRVEKSLSNWHGGLRVGFTNVPPSSRSLPLPPLAIPDLTDVQGHWAAPVPESQCQVGSELEFWVSGRGVVYITSNNITCKLLAGVYVSQPLWAMIDVYGQTCSISLLGSRKRMLCSTKHSCPAPEPLPSPDNHHTLIPDVSSLCGNTDGCISCLDRDVPAGGSSVLDCVVCINKQATITLPCGHRCLCSRCACKVIQQFGTCPLCRHRISAPE